MEKGESENLWITHHGSRDDLRRAGGVWRGASECCLWCRGEGLGTAASLWVGLTQFYYCTQTDNIFRIAWCASVQCEFIFHARLVGIIFWCVESSLMIKCKQLCEVTFLAIKQVGLKATCWITESLSVHCHALTFTRVRKIAKSDYELRHACLSACPLFRPSAWNNAAPTG
jgi:hypothetical protein